MREILFRGKRAYGGEWVEGFYYMQRGKYAGDKSFCYEYPTITTGIVETSGAYGESSEAIEYEVIPETVGQYTGITDKTGKKIFEGDIVKEYNIFGVEVGIGAVHWSDLFLAWHITKNKSMYSGNIASYEVIGNIHDNPELLEGGK